MELRHALQAVVRSGVTTSQALLGQSAPRWLSPAPRWAPSISCSARYLSTTKSHLADRPATTPARKQFPSLSKKPDSRRTAFDSWAQPSAASSPSSPTKPGQSSKPPSVFGEDLDDPMDLARDIGLQADEFLRSHMPKAAAPPPLRLRASTGKTIQVHGHVDVVRSFQLLDVLCARNKLPRTVQQQRFHERPGLKRKRLKRERWRKKFKTGFKATVQRVRELSKQGW